MRNNWIKSTVINCIIMLVVISLTRLCYETNDDYGLALRIQAGYDDVLLINRFLARFLVVIQERLGLFNAFVLFQLICSLLAFIIVFKILLDQSRGALFDLAAALIILIFSFDHYSVFQFTKTGALLVMAGMVVIVDVFFEKRSLSYLLMGLLFLFVGSSLRFMNTYVAVAFSAATLGFLIVDRRETLKASGVFSKRSIAVQLVVIILICGTYVWKEVSFRGEGIQEYKAYNRYRSDVIDYPVFQNYDKMKDEMKKLGISRNDLYLIDHWFIDYDGAASPKNLKAIDQVYKRKILALRSVPDTMVSFLKGTVRQMREGTPRGIHLVLLGLIAVCGLICLRPKYWVFIALTGALAICFHMYIYYAGRTVSRAFYVVDICTAFFLIYSYDRDWLRGGDEKSRIRIGKISFCIMSIGMCLLLGPLYYHNVNHEAPKNDGNTSAIVREYTRDNSDKVFVFGTREKGHDPAYQTPWRLPEKGTEQNVLTFGNWGTGSSYVSDKMHGLGLNNVFSDTIDNPDVLIVMNDFSEELQEYLNKWYGRNGEKIVMEQVDKVDGLKVWRVKSDSR